MTSTSATRTGPSDPLPALPLARSALFLDFDGTIAEIAEHPDAVVVGPDLVALIDRLSRASGGALAIVTGRDIESVDRFLSPLKLPVAGVHGFVRRRSSGDIVEAQVDAAALYRIGTAVATFADRHGGLLLERKSASVALHYRLAPHLADAARDAMSSAIAAEPGFALLAGKAVFEARSLGHDKGEAIAAFMREAPFLGRMPVFAGDDVTDEDGFIAVNALGGFTVKVGEGPTVARARVPSTADLHAWLRTLG